MSQKQKTKRQATKTPRQIWCNKLYKYHRTSKYTKRSRLLSWENFRGKYNKKTYRRNCGDWRNNNWNRPKNCQPWMPGVRSFDKDPTGLGTCWWWGSPRTRSSSQFKSKGSTHKLSRTSSSTICDTSYFYYFNKSSIIKKLIVLHTLSYKKFNFKILFSRPYLKDYFSSSKMIGSLTTH